MDISSQVVHSPGFVATSVAQLLWGVVCHAMPYYSTGVLAPVSAPATVLAIQLRALVLAMTICYHYGYGIAQRQRQPGLLHKNFLTLPFRNRVSCCMWTFERVLYYLPLCRCAVVPRTHLPRCHFWPSTAWHMHRHRHEGTPVIDNDAQTLPSWLPTATPPEYANVSHTTNS